jgi:hypothetical protein
MKKFELIIGQIIIDIAKRSKDHQRSLQEKKISLL